KRAVDHPLYNVLLKMPNPDTTATVHWEAQVAAMLMRGWGRAEILKMGNRVVGLNFLDPARLQVRKQNGKRRYFYLQLNGKHREIPESRIFGIPGFSINGRDGLSAIKYGYQVFGTALAADKASGNTFENGMMPTT